jgi:hypothetical protein
MTRLSAAGRTIVVQTAQSSDLMRRHGESTGVFHKLFHRSCEEPVTPNGDVT